MVLGLNKVKRFFSRLSGAVGFSFYGGHSSSGEYVSSSTAMGVPAYFAAIRAISEDIAKLPIVVTAPKDGRNERITGGRLPNLFNTKANELSVSIVVRQAIVASALANGDGYAEIVFNGRGEPAGLWPVDYHIVEPRITNSNKLVYDVRAGNGVTRTLDDSHMFHLRGPGDNGLTGWSVLRYAMESLGGSISTQRMAASFFGNSANPSMLLKHPGNPDASTIKVITDKFKAMFSGAKNTGKIGVLPDGMDIVKLTIPPNEAQFLETRQFQIEEIARWFRMPPHKLQHLLRATYSNIEEQNTEYVQDTLQPWMSRFEQEAQAKLRTHRESSWTIRHNANALLRGNSKARSEFYRTMVAFGGLTINEVRELEDMNPVEGGDKVFVPLNMVELGKESGTEQESPKDEMTSEDQAEQVRAASIGVFKAACDRLCRKESKRIQDIERKGDDAKAKDKFYNETLPHDIDLTLSDPIKSLIKTISIIEKTSIDVDIQAAEVLARVKEFAWWHTPEFITHTCASAAKG